MKPVLHLLTMAYLTVKSIEFKSKKENKVRWRTCQTRRRRFLALALRVEVSLILFQRRPPESCFFTNSSTLVPQNAPHAVAIIFSFAQHNGNCMLWVRERDDRNWYGWTLMGYSIVWAKPKMCYNFSKVGAIFRRENKQNFGHFHEPSSALPLH